MKTELKREQQWRDDRTVSLLCRLVVKLAALELGRGAGAWRGKGRAYGICWNSRGSWDLRASWVRSVVEPGAENDDADVRPSGCLATDHT